MLHLKTAKLARWQVRLLCWGCAALWLSGVAWLLLHNFIQVQSDFGPEANPLEPWMLRIHGAAMQIVLLGLGSLLVVHVWRGWTYRSQRALGISLLSVAGLLIVSGFMLYYVGDEDWRGVTSTAHWIVGILALPMFLLHYFQGKRIRRG